MANGKASSFRVGLIQMRSGRSPQANTDAAAKLIGEAKNRGAEYVLTPEMTNIMETGRERFFASIVPEEQDAALMTFRELARTLGIFVHVLPPGEAPGYYHAESEQEGFLVLSGECVAIVEGQERRMQAWDYLHCPPGTAHITVGAGDEPCAILMVGTRSESHSIRYLVDPLAAEHGAAVAQESNSPEEVYADRPPSSAAPAPAPFA